MEYSFNKIGSRIKKLRKSKKLSQEDLIFALKDDYNFSISRNTLSKIENEWDNFEPEFSFKFLYYFSNMFECDIGYLLGEYDEKTKETHEICEYTGLSEGAANVLHTRKNKQVFDILNSILESINFWSLLDRLDEYRNMAESAFRDEEWLSEGDFNRFNDIAITPQAKEAQFKLLQIQQLLNIQRLVNLIKKDGAKNG